VIVADRSVDLGEQLVAGLRDQEFSASFLPVDIADPASVQHCVDAAVAVYGILHYGINCAGIGGPTVPGACERPASSLADDATAHTVPTKGWKAVLDIDAAGAFYFTQSLVRYFRTVTPRVVRQADAEWNLPAVEERGAIVNIASVRSFPSL
jgi:NAD(P)-dependent dehydrogenase (short-subunit alcohol dehydrogenase family)